MDRRQDLERRAAFEVRISYLLAQLPTATEQEREEIEQAIAREREMIRDVVLQGGYGQ